MQSNPVCVIPCPLVVDKMITWWSHFSVFRAAEAGGQHGQRWTWCKSRHAGASFSCQPGNKRFSWASSTSTAAPSPPDHELFLFNQHGEDGGDAVRCTSSNVYFCNGCTVSRWRKDWRSEGAKAEWQDGREDKKHRSVSNSSYSKTQPPRQTTRIAAA